VAAWWRRVSASERPFEPEYLALQEAALASRRLITGEPSDIHAQLLARRMELLQLEPGELDRTDPMLFQELQATCLYCPNSTQLTLLATLKRCD
jgi:hypothetical protein